MTNQLSTITQVKGFRALGIASGIKSSGQPDMALILADAPCNAAALFTTNQFKAAPVLYDQALLERTDHLQAIIVNSGNANAVTGQRGDEDAVAMARHTEAACQLPTDSAFVMSTGVIGHYLPMDTLHAGIDQLARDIKGEAGQRGDLVAEAIMTTDLVAKSAFTTVEIDGRTINIGGISKGSGMIHPNMATMLGVLVTDAPISSADLRQALIRVNAVTFNAITVDGDTSTNDTVIALASGQADIELIKADTAAFETFVEGLTEVSRDLAKKVARDGEGATKLLEITLRGAADTEEAHQAARKIATSPLVKTAFFGNDPNWGRILASLGQSGIQLVPAQTQLWFGDYQLLADGAPTDFDSQAVSAWMKAQDEIKVTLELGVGAAHATVWTCDYSYKYIQINAEYDTYL